MSLDIAFGRAMGQVLADVAEGHAAVANFRDKGVPRSRRILLAASFAVPVLFAAILAYLTLHNAGDVRRMGALETVAGISTVAVLEDMVKEAHDANEDSRISLLAFVGGFVFFSAISTVLG